MEPVQNHDTNRYNKVPVVMLDYSRSVSDEFSKSINIFEKLVLLLKDVAKHDGFDSIHLIMWSSIGKYMGQLKVSDIDGTALYQSKPIVSSGANLYAGLKIITHVMHNNIPGAEPGNEIIPIYVFTNGNIDDDEWKLSRKIRAINQFNQIYDLRMIVLENNDKEYLIDNQTDVNALVRFVRQHNLRDTIKYILFFNRLYDTFEHKFINLYTATLSNDYVQYNDKCFHVKNYALFLAYISSKINKIKAQIDAAETLCQNNNLEEGDTPNKHIDMMIKTNIGLLEMIGYNLIKTINDLARIKNLKKINKLHLIDFFCNLIGIDKITELIKNGLMWGDNDKTFEEYREERIKVITTTQSKMYLNLKESISIQSSEQFTSFIEYSNDNTSPLIYLIESENIDHSINIGIREYKHAGIYDYESKRLVPIIPISDQFTHDNYQAIRQWIRAIYSKRYGIPASSDLIIYTFLIDNMYVQCSDVPGLIKDTYINISTIMLGSARYSQIVDEGIFLSKKIKEQKIDEWMFLQNCPNYPTFHTTLCKMDEPKYILDCILGSMIGDRIDVLDGIKKSNLNKIPTLKKISLIKKVDPKYYCVITMTDTDETGGYMFYPHPRVDKTSTCRPKYVMSQEACDFYTENNTAMRCPLCTTVIDMTRMIQVESKKEYERINQPIAQNKESMRIYKNVEIYDEYSDELIKLNELDFSNNYRHRVHFKEHIILGSAMDSYSVIKLDPNNKQQVFNEKVPNFLLKIDMANVVVAGGMCRSILLGQKIQDIDMFFVGLTEDGVKQRLIPLINDIVTTLQEEDHDYRFIMMHKPINSVVEILCTKSTFDESQIDDEMDNNITLSEKYLFSQNEVIHKVQIILKAHHDIKHIFDEFDMHCSCVAFDGVDTVFNEASYIAFKYMVNLVDPIKARHTAYNHRALKYHGYGFSIGLYKKMFTQELLYKLENLPKVIKISGCVFELTDRRSLIVSDENDQPIESSIRYFPIDSFKLESKNKSNNLKSCNEPTNNYQEPQDPPMYESYQGNLQSYEDLTSCMAGLYNYMLDNDIRYCYLFGKIDQDSVYDVIDIDNIKFLKRNRDYTYNWYSSEQIHVDG